MSGACPSSVTSVYADITGCFFIDYVGGSDANTGVDEAHPWKTVKGMANSTGTAAAHTPVPGDGFIFKGGVTWDQAIGRWNLTGSGNATNRIYYGVDPTWFTGGSWTRPIFSAGGVANPYNSNTQDFISGFDNRPINYIIWDNFEHTGLFLLPNINGCSGGGGTTSCGYTNNFSGTNWEVLNTYTHGVSWSPYGKCVQPTGGPCGGTMTISNITSLSAAASGNQFTCVGCNFTTAGFLVGGPYLSVGFTNGANNGQFSVTAVGTTTLTVSTTSVTETTGYVTPGMTLVTEGPNTTTAGITGTQNIGNHLNGFGGHLFHHNVIDNSDGVGLSLVSPSVCCRGTLPFGDVGGDTYLNVCRWVCDCHNASNSSGGVLTFHDNRVDNIYRSFDPQDHENAYEDNNTTTGSTTLFYNNYLEAGLDNSGAVQSWSVGSAGGSIYGFNNVWSQNSVALVNGATTNSGGTINIFQNTIGCGGGGVAPTNKCILLTGAMNYVIQNNFYITNNAAGGGTAHTIVGTTTGTVTTAPTFSIDCGAGGGNNVNPGGVQICAPIGSGNGTGNLNLTQTFPYVPLDSTALTSVGVGSSISSLCTTISGLNSTAGTACQSDTTFGPTYDSVNHKVTGRARTTFLRNLAAPHNGAYELTGLGTGGTLALGSVKQFQATFF